jgi:hypothetical protein
MIGDNWHARYRWKAAALSRTSCKPQHVGVVEGPLWSACGRAALQCCAAEVLLGGRRTNSVANVNSNSDKFIMFSMFSVGCAR